MKEIIITENEANQRLDRFLKKYLNKADVSYIQKMIRKKNIKVNGRKTTGNYRIAQNDFVQIYLADDTINKFREEKTFISTEIKPEIIYSDENLILLNKPAGITVHSDDNDEITLLDILLNNLEYEKSVSFRPSFANRLDKNTSGIIIACRSYDFLREINKAIRERKISKIYRTIVHGKIVEEKHLKDYACKDNSENKLIVSNIKQQDAKEILTVISPVKFNEKYSELEVNLITGMSHQIRAHLSHEGFPLLGDSKYGSDSKFSKYQLLHSWKICFQGLPEKYSYLNGKCFEAPLPDEYIRIRNKVFKD